MSKGGWDLLRLIFSWGRIVRSAKDTKQLPPEQRQKVVRFGVLAVIYAFVTALCACALLLFKVGFDSGIFLGIIFLIVAIGAGVLGTLISLITTLVYWFSQLSINRRAGTWITLVFVLIGLAAAVAVPLFFLG